MTKLNENKKHQDTLAAVMGYDQALKNQKELHLKKVRAAVPSTPELDAAWDAVFVLDYMIASNQQAIHFLKLLDENKNSRANKALNDLLGTLEKDPHANIHLFMQEVKDKLKKDGKQAAQPLSNYYGWLNVLAATGSVIMYFGGAAGLTVAIVAMILMPPAVFLPFLIVPIVVVSVYLMMHAREFLQKAREVDSAASSLDQPENGIYKQSFREVVKVTAADGNSTTETIQVTTKEEMKTRLRENFFKKKAEPTSSTLSEDVQAEYTLLMGANG